VSHPATPAAPPALIAAAFGERLEAAQQYVDLLLTDGVVRGLIGPREADRIWERHLANSAALGSLIPHGVGVTDIGSGAGLPGVPLALLRPDLQVVLLEPMQRRVDFLVECIGTLGLTHVVVRRGRAPEDLRPAPGDFGVVRAVAPLDRLVDTARPLLRAGGTLLALKGRAAQAEMDTVRRQNLPVRLDVVPASFADQSATVVRVRPA
jgi:16S rRNA (guanine527-N7)-methyltransferase